MCNNFNNNYSILITTMEDGYIINRRLQFVSNYEWIWNIKLTRLFVDNHLLKIPQEV